jgi:hypothetical protein
VILFKPEHVEPILSGRKTQTRRLGKKRWNVGALHQARTRMMDPTSLFARLRILAVRRQRLQEMSFADVHAEGYNTHAEYIAEWMRINRVFPPGLVVWVVEFEVETA